MNVLAWLKHEPADGVNAPRERMFAPPDEETATAELTHAPTDEVNEEPMLDVVTMDEAHDLSGLTRFNYRRISPPSKPDNFIYSCDL